MNAKHLFATTVYLNLFGGLLNAQGPAGAALETVTGTIRQVTLYQGTGLVSRQVDLPQAKSGTFEIVVTPLPSATSPDSVYADGSEGVEVRSVQCRARPPANEKETETEVAKLDREIRELTRKIATSRNEIALRRIRQEYLRGLESFVAPAVGVEMTHGVLQAKELEQITLMHFREYETASQEVLNLGFQIDDDQLLLDRLRIERDKLATGPPVTYDVVVLVEKAAAGPASFRLNYLVSDCGWSPYYNVRGDTQQGATDIEFNALIHQVSGEDWKNASLVLSTASPTVSAYNPRLAPLYVRVGPSDSAQTLQEYGSAVEQLNRAVEMQGRIQSVQQAADNNFVANDLAASVQLMELSERMSELRRLSDGGAMEDLSIDYALPAPVNLVSRRESQTVPVFRHRGTATFYHVAVPVLTPSVFREARVTNDSPHDLLGGKVNVYLDGRFTGRTDMPTIARGRGFTLGFGVDGQLRARRTVTDREELVQGGNRRVTVTSEVVFDSFKNEEVTVFVRERTPHTEDDSALRVTLGTMSHALDAEPDYERFEQPKGILLWQLKVKPGSGDTATTLRYSYALEFDKSLTLREISEEQKRRLKTDFLNESRASGVKDRPILKK